MEHDAPAWAVALQGSGLGALMRGSPYLYPAANLAHVLGLGFLLGPIVLLDLRVLGLGQAVPLEVAARILGRVAGSALAILVASGLALFAADAVGLAANPLMQAKLALVAVGVVNALLFRLDRPILVQRAQASASLVIWLLAAMFGRLAAYV
jgi:hypothetical protein